MSWLDKILPLKIRNRSGSSSVPESLWHKCPSCSAIIYSTELKRNSEAYPKYNHHNPLSARECLNLLSDGEDRKGIAANIKPTDPLKFKDSRKYPDRLVAVHKAAGEDGALVAMKGTMNSLPVMVVAFKFRFIGGSIGSVVGERSVQDIRRAIAGNCSFICMAASGGARMQEGVNPLMQMTKTSTALHLLTEKRLPFISVLANPAMGGVSANFAFLGDVVLAKPNAPTGFAGPRVIKQIVRETLSEDSQHAELLLGKGAIDQIVDRRPIKECANDLIILLRHEGKVTAT